MSTTVDQAGIRDPMRSPLDDLATALGVLVVAGLVARLHGPVEARLRYVRTHPAASLEASSEAARRALARVTERLGVPAAGARPPAGEPSEKPVLDGPLTPAT